MYANKPEMAKKWQKKKKNEKVTYHDGGRTVGIDVRDLYNYLLALKKANPAKFKKDMQNRHIKAIFKRYSKGGEMYQEGKDRDYKDEYKKFQSSTKAKKYRAELNKYNRQKGTYGNGDGKDASHKGGKIVGFESQSKNRGRAEKSRLKKENIRQEIEEYVDGILDGIGEEFMVNEAFRPSDRKVLMVIGRDVINNIKKKNPNLKPSKQLGQALNSIFRAMTRGKNDPNYQQYKKYFPKYNDKLLKRLSNAYFNEPFNVQNTFIKKVMDYSLKEGKWSKMMRAVRKGPKSGPWQIIVSKNNKVVKEVPVKTLQLIPAHYDDIKKAYPNHKIGIEAKDGKIVYREWVVNIKEGTCGYGIDGNLGEEPAGPHLLKKKKKKKDEVSLGGRMAKKIGKHGGTRDKGEIAKILKLLIKRGNKKKDAMDMINKNYDRVSKAYRKASPAKKAEILSSLQESVNEAKYKGYDYKRQNRKDGLPLIVPALRKTFANMKDLKKYIDKHGKMESVTEMNSPMFKITYKDSRGAKKTDIMRAKNSNLAKRNFNALHRGRGFKILKVVKEAIKLKGKSGMGTISHDGMPKASKGVEKLFKIADTGFGKVGGQTVDSMSANLFKQIYNKANDDIKKKLNQKNEKQLIRILAGMWDKFGKNVKIGSGL